MDGRWINQCNEVEAKAVVDLLRELLLKDMNKSMGIITFNEKQQDKIHDLIDDLPGKTTNHIIFCFQIDFSCYNKHRDKKTGIN